MIHDEINQVLTEIAALKTELEDLQAEYQQRMEALAARYVPHMDARKQALRDSEARLKKLCKAHQSEVFSSGDRVDLPAGAVILSQEQRVRRARGVLDALKRLGWTDAIKVKESVDWAALESWPDERLVAVGTERITKTDIHYEVKS